MGLEYNNDGSRWAALTTDGSSPRNARFVVAPGILTMEDTSDSLTGWHMLTLVVKQGTASLYVDGVQDGTSTWLFQGLDKITSLSIGRGTGDASTDGGPDATFDEATFSTVPRTAPIGYLPVTTTKSPAPPT